MAVLGSITLNEVLILEVDSDPSIEGLEAPSGSLALLTDGTAFFLKKQEALTGWQKLSKNAVDTKLQAINGLTSTDVQAALSEIQSNFLTHASRHLPNGQDALTTETPVATGVSNSLGSSNSFARADHIHNTVISNLSNSATGNTTTTSITDILLNAMTLTSIDNGTYLVICGTSITHNTNGATTTLSIYANNVQSSGSERVVIARASNNNFQHSLITFAVVTVTAGQVIEARWRTSASTATAGTRSITITRLG